MGSKARKEYNSLRNVYKENLGGKCVNCGSTENVEYHHIVPLCNGGSNKLSNIAPLCQKCHYKAHDRTYKKTGKTGRKKISTYIDAEPILDMYFSNEIGKAECLEKLGYSRKNHTCTLFNEYKTRHNINNFYNHVDIKNAQQNKKTKT